MDPNEQAVERDGYALAFYELAALMGIGARAETPSRVWRNEMFPVLAKALASVSPSVGKYATVTAEHLARRMGCEFVRHATVPLSAQIAVSEDDRYTLYCRIISQLAISRDANKLLDVIVREGWRPPAPVNTEISGETL